MDTIPVVAPTFVAILAVLAIIAGGVAFLKTQIGEKTVALQKEEITALEQRLKTEHESVVQLTARVQAVEAENRLLRGMVTQEHAITNLATAVAGHHTASEQAWMQILTAIKGKS